MDDFYMAGILTKYSTFVPKIINIASGTIQGAAEKSRPLNFFAVFSATV